MAAVGTPAAGAAGAAGGAGRFETLDTAAMPFITVTDDDKFEVNPEAIAYLKTLTGKIAVVSIAGIYRTGKSYLLNQLMGKSGAFGVGNTVKACTKGIWLWGRAMEVDGSEVTALFLDTEGLGSTVRSETYDCRVFALALLLSSYFIYNSFGTIDGNAISKLSLVVNLTKHIHVRSAAGARGEDNGTEFNQFFPHFLWVVRDFSVKLERDGRKISSREYLEDALRPEEGVSEATEAKNAVRMLIRSFFPERDCVTLVRPVMDEKQLMALSSLPGDALRPEFRAQIDAMRRRLATALRPKTLYGKPLNGAMLASLAEAYCGALNAGATPTISTAWDRVVESQCQEASEGGVRTYRDTMASGLAVAAARRNAGTVRVAPTTLTAAGAGAAAAAALVGGGGSSSSTSGLASTSARRGSGSGASGFAAAAAAAGAGSSSPAPSASAASAASAALTGPAPPYAEESTIVEDGDMATCHDAASAAAERFFAERAVQDSDRAGGYLAEMRSGIAEAHARFRRANEAASGAFCLELLDRLHAGATARLSALKRGAAAAAAGGSADSSAGRRRASGAESGSGAGSGSGATAGAGVTGDGNSFSADGQASSSSAGGEGSGITPAIAAAAAAVVPAATVAREYKAACEAISASYASQARGPARHKVLAEFLTDRLPALLVEASMTSDDSRSAESAAHRARLGELSQQLVAARGRERVAAETLVAERRSFETASADASRRAAEREETLKSTLASRVAELERLQGRFDRLLAASEAASVRADEAAATAAAQLASARARVDELQSARVTALLDMTTMSQRLAEAEAARADAIRLAGELRAKLAQEAAAAAVLAERCRGAENETVRLRESSELLFESCRVQKDLLAAKQDELGEAEWQWGVAKGRVAQMESELSDVSSQLTVMTSVATQLKGHLLKAGKAAVKGLTLDRLEQRAYDTLPAGTGAGAGSA